MVVSLFAVVLIQKICLDVDECLEDQGGCEHSCHNEIGTFNCSCNDGFELDSNGFNCNSKPRYCQCEAHLALYFYCRHQ